ncbi:MAG: cytidine deaminase [Planctomycetes bacterium]|nr:cytidine deaminase [Planctomycetota bacterium]
MKISLRDRELVDEARRLIRRRYEPDRHHVAAAVRTRSGRVFTALHLDTYVGRCSICAEAAAVARAATEGDRELDTIVAVRFRGRGQPRVVSPCGACRELLADYGDPLIIYSNNGGLHKARASRLLPAKYSRPEEPR